jgi:hypothetical protein
MGDRESVLSVTDSLVSACKIVRPIPYSYKPTLGDNTNDSRPKPEQIIQYYRASSFILSLDGYNNTFALPSNAPSNNNDGPRNTTMVPLPNISDRNFLNCVNSTIGDKIPLIQPDPALSAGAITGIVFAGIFAIVILFACCKYFLFVRLVNGLRKVKPRKKSTYVSFSLATCLYKPDSFADTKILMKLILTQGSTRSSRTQLGITLQCSKLTRMQSET